MEPQQPCVTSHVAGAGAAPQPGAARARRQGSDHRQCLPWRRPPVQQLLVLALLLAACQLPLSAAGDWTEGRNASKALAAQASQRHWHAAMHRLQSMQLDGHRLGDFLGHVMRHTYTLPMPQVQKGLVYTGSNFRLRKVVHDLILGKRPIKVAAIGGSITNGAKASVIGKTDWFSLVGAYLTAAFPRANVTTHNGALPATPSALMNMCLEQYVPADVDLVFVEYVANDGSNRFDEVKAKVYERLLRKLLNRPSRPSVVLLQLMPKGMAFAPGRRDKVPFHATLEDIYGAQAQYYDLPWLSWRNAMYRLAEFHTHGHNWTDWMWDVDMMHPIDPGMAAISDLAVHLIQQTALGLLLNPLGRADRELLQERLPPPMHQDNWEAKNLMCTYGEGFRPLVDEAASRGWAFVNEGKPGAPKWGFIATQPGSVLRIRVNSLRGEGGDRSQRMNVMLAYLKSYQGMGMAKFECTSGCNCEPRGDVDALHSLHQSTIYLVRLLVSQAAACEISVTLLDKSSSDGHKFKVSGIMMNEYLGADITEKLHEEQWLTQLQATARTGGERAVGSERATSKPGAGGSEPALKAEAKAELASGSRDGSAPVGKVVQSAADGGPSDRRHLLGIAARVRQLAGVLGALGRRR